MPIGSSRASGARSPRSWSTSIACAGCVPSSVSHIRARSRASRTCARPSPRTFGVADADALLRAVLRGAMSAWPGGSEADEERFFDACGRHGVAGLVERRLRLAGTIDDWPATIASALRAAVFEHAAVAAVREHQLRDVIDALAASDAGAILIKGAALARTHYPHP